MIQVKPASAMLGQAPQETAHVRNGIAAQQRHVQAWDVRRASGRDDVAQQLRIEVQPFQRVHEGRDRSGLPLQHCSVERRQTQGGPGLLLLHGNGNVFERLLAPGEKIMVEPGGFLYKDSTVQMNTVQLPVKISMLRRSMFLAEMVGPGRVGIQSMYVHHGSE